MSETGHAASLEPAETGPLPRLSILVPLFNQLALTKAMLASLLASIPTQITFEVILVDDGSTDGTRDWLAGLKDERIHVLLNEENLGFAATNNRGAALARGEFLALLNNDLVLQPGWLEPMLEVFARRGVKAGIVGNLQLRVSDGTLDHAGIRATRDAKLVHIRRHPKPAPQGREVLAVTAACCLLRRAEFERVGGFDSSYVNGGEDVDLCLRLRSGGLLCLIAPSSIIHHHVSASRGPSSLKDEQNSRRLFSKWSVVLEDAIASAWCDRPAAHPSPSLWHGFAARLYRNGLLRQTPPHARLLARSALHREQTRWKTLLDGTPAPKPVLLRATGFSWDADTSPAWIPRSASLELGPGTPTTHLFVGGHLSAGEAEEQRSHPLGLRLSINSLQVVDFQALQPGDFNLAVDAPASQPEHPTLVQIDVLGNYPFSLLVEWLIRLSFLPKGFRRRLRRHSRAHDGKRLRISTLVADDLQIADFSRAPKTPKDA